MACDLQAPIGDLECAHPLWPAAILRMDQFLEHIEMRRLDARAESIPNALGKLADFGKDPAHEVGSQQNCGRLAKASRPLRGSYLAWLEFGHRPFPWAFYGLGLCFRFICHLKASPPVTLRVFVEDER